MLISAGFSDTSNDKYEKYYPLSDCSIVVDFRKEKIIYPENKGFKVNIATTTNFSEPENFVVLISFLGKGIDLRILNLNALGHLAINKKVDEQIFAYLIKMGKCYS